VLPEIWIKCAPKLNCKKHAQSGSPELSPAVVVAICSPPKVGLELRGNCATSLTSDYRSVMAKKNVGLAQAKIYDW